MAWHDTLTFAGAICAGITGGVLFGFSTFVMPALGRLPAAQGTAAMQAINRAAPTPPLMAVLFGAGLAGLPLAISALGDLDQSAARLQLAGALLSIATVVITAAFHVPRNNALDALDPVAPATAHEWSCKLRTWTLGNHVRVATSLAACAAWILALRVR